LLEIEKVTGKKAISQFLDVSLGLRSMEKETALGAGIVGT
jgi:hypothetical protein